MLLTLQYTVANLSRLLYNTVANLASQFSLFGKLWDLVWRKGLLCVNLTTLLPWGRCLVKHNCCYPPAAEWDSSVLYFEDCKFSTFPSSRCWRVVHCGRASLGGNHLVNQAAACRSPGARAAHPSQTLSASLTLAGLFINLGKICKSPSLSQLSYIIQLYSAKSQRRKKPDELGTTDLSQGFIREALFAEHNHPDKYVFLFSNLRTSNNSAVWLRLDELLKEREAP